MKEVNFDELADRLEHLCDKGEYNDALRIISSSKDIYGSLTAGIRIADTLITAGCTDEPALLEFSDIFLSMFSHKGKDDPVWNYLKGKCLYFSERYIEALGYLEQSKSLFSEQSEISGGYENIFDDLALEAGELYSICKNDVDMRYTEYSDEDYDSIFDHIEETFGKIAEVFHVENTPIPFKIIYIPPNDKRRCGILCTVGVSAYKMNTPEDSPAALFKYAELMIYIPHEYDPRIDKESCDWAFSYLIKNAMAPIKSNFYLTFGFMTVGHADEKKSGSPFYASAVIPVNGLLGESEKRKAVFSSNVKKDYDTDQRPIIIYQLFPLYYSEYEMIAMKNKPDLLRKILEKYGSVIYPDRKCISECSDKNEIGEKNYTPDLNIGKYCHVSPEIIYENKRVGYLQRQKKAFLPDNANDDSGWIILTERESETHNISVDRLVKYELNSACNIEPAITRFILEPYGTVIRRKKDGTFEIEKRPKE